MTANATIFSYNVDMEAARKNVIVKKTILIMSVMGMADLKSEGAFTRFLLSYSLFHDKN